MPHIVAIAGGTASGKTTLTRKLLELIGVGVSDVVELDGYYRDQSQVPINERASVNYDHPDSFEFDLLCAQLLSLKKGESIEVPVYDFSTYTRKVNEVRRVEPLPVIFVEGILTLVIPILRPLFDTTIFVEAPDSVRLERRIGRDVRERGRTRESVLQQWISTVQPMHTTYCEPSKEYAELVVDGNEISSEVVAQVYDYIVERTHLSRPS